MAVALAILDMKKHTVVSCCLQIGAGIWGDPLKPL